MADKACLVILSCLLWMCLLVVHSEVTEKDFRCRRTLPSEGAFMDEPPYYFPKYCPTPNRFDEASSERCLKNRTVYVMGNSIARQFLFNTVEILGGEAVDRENQKRYCPKLEVNWDANSCRKEYKGGLQRWFLDKIHACPCDTFTIVLSESPS